MFCKIAAIITYGLLALTIALGILANLIGIGYALYLWAHDTELSKALWEGFVLWIQTIGLAIFTWIIALGAAYASDKYTRFSRR